MAGTLVFPIPWSLTSPLAELMLAMLVGAAVVIGLAEVFVRVAGERPAVYGMMLVALLAFVLMVASLDADGTYPQGSLAYVVRGVFSAAVPTALALTRERGRRARSRPSVRAFLVSGGRRSPCWRSA